MPKILWKPICYCPVVLSNNILITSGKDSLTRYPEGESKTGRIICNKCTFKLYTKTTKGQPISVHTSTLENEAGVEVMAHTNVESKSSAFAISDSLPQFSSQITKDGYMKLID